MTSKNNARKLNDLYAKCRFIDWLLPSLSGDYALVSELLYSEQQRYADIVAITPNQLTAYEIKSEKDTTVRLLEQLNCYQRTFDYTYVVCHKKHVEKILSLLPSGIGLIVESEPRKFSIIKKAKKSTTISNVSLLSHYARHTIEKIFQVKLNKQLALHWARVEVSPEINTQILLEQYRKDLYNKYKEATQLFIGERLPNYTNPDDLFTISRQKTPLITPRQDPSSEPL